MVSRGGRGHEVQLWDGDERRRTQCEGFGASAVPVSGLHPSEKSAELRGTAWPGIKQHRMGGEELDPREERSWDPESPSSWSMNSRGR